MINKPESSKSPELDLDFEVGTKELILQSDNSPRRKELISDRRWMYLVGLVSIFFIVVLFFTKNIIFDRNVLHILKKSPSICTLPIQDYRLSNGLMGRRTVFVDTVNNVVIYRDIGARSTDMHVYDFKNLRYGYLWGYGKEMEMKSMSLTEMESAIRSIGEGLPQEDICLINYKKVYSDYFDCEFKSGNYVCRWLY
jgi:hypothetical protein